MNIIDKKNESTKKINYLKVITQELAREIDLNEHGPIISLLEIIFDKINSLVFIINMDDVVVYANRSAIDYIKSTYGVDILNEKWYCCFGDEKPKDNLIHDEAIKKRKVINRELHSPLSNIDFNVTAIPLIYNGTTGTICILNIIDRNE